MRKLKNEELDRLAPEAFRQAAKQKACLVLDDVRSLHNVGSVFRTADAFLLEKIWLCGITGTPPHREIQKTALGATETVAWTHHPEILKILQLLRAEGWTVVSVEQAEGSVSLEQFQPDLMKKYAFVLGNEVFGVKQEVVSASDLVLEIPQFGSKHSLNIAVSAGIVVWDFVSKTALRR